MKSILTSLFLFIAIFAEAADTVTTYVYRGEVAGVVCSACSNTVKTALGKLEGVQSVKITLGEQAGLPKLEVVSTSPRLTREAAVKALGESAKMFDIRSLNLVPAK